MIQNRDNLIAMYPNGAKKIQQYVSNACDRLDYKNSPIYDDYPDQVFIDRLSESISDTIITAEGLDAILGYWDLPQESKIEEIMPMEIQQVQWREFWPGNRPPGPPPGPPPGNRPPGPPPGPPPWGPPPGPRPPKPEPPWFRDMVRVQLLNEIFRRRCRRGNCII